MDTVQLIAFVLTSLHCRLLVHSSKPRKIQSVGLDFYKGFLSFKAKTSRSTK